MQDLMKSNFDYLYLINDRFDLLKFFILIGL